MANINILKRRINAARNVSKTTRAMQMIAASKLKKAQDAVSAGRPYVTKISELLSDTLNESKKDYTHPYLKNGTASNDKTLLIVLSPDKGLCGGLITNLAKEFLRFQDETPKVSHIVVGKKLEGQVVHFSQEIIASFPFGTSLPTYEKIFPLLSLINEYYNTGKVSTVKILTAEYVSIFSQTPKVIDLLPIIPEIISQEEKNEDFFIFEPGKKNILDSLINHYLEMTLFQQLIESYLSEQAARMISMQNATNNANDIIEDLQLEHNKARQAKITSEILDITGAQVGK
jgi:F-type H+-transporting ATPase subunit gamma